MRLPENLPAKEDLKLKPLEDNKSEWSRPDWFSPGGSTDHMRKIVWGETGQFFINNVFGGVDSYIMCPICRQLCAFMGASIDHIIDWKTYATKMEATTYYDLYRCYHDLNNLILMHGGCNSHKKSPSLAATLAKHHTSDQTATWNRCKPVADLCRLVEVLYEQEKPNIMLQQSVQNNIVKKFNNGGWHAVNAYASLRRRFGDTAVDKAIKKLTTGI